MFPRSSPPALAAALASAAVLLTACSNDAQTPSPAKEVVRATRITEVADSDSPLTPGPYAMGIGSDRTDTPMVVIDVPAGYVGRGDGFEIFADIDGPAFRHFDTWTVSEVAENPCGETEYFDPGPTVDDLADALAALPVWETTPPAPRTIDGHAGVFLELNVPDKMPAECHDRPRSWIDVHGSTQGIGPGKTQLLWIVDVDGHRLMLVAGYFPGRKGPTPQQVDEMIKMAEGARFVDDDQIAP